MWFELLMLLTSFPEVGPIGDSIMLEQVQIIKDNDVAKFAVIPFTEYLTLKEMLSDEEKLADYLDYLHVQKVKKESRKRISLEQVKKELALD